MPTRVAPDTGDRVEEILSEEVSPDVRSPVHYGSRVVLVSCVSRKRRVSCRARDLYTSRARTYVEAQACRWLILSAEHGLLHPDQVIAPYERTLNQMGVSERRSWANYLRGQLDRELPVADEIVVLAGNRYREFLMDDLRGRANRVCVPMEGPRLGEQLNWLGRGRST